jgi:hypothetical protein
MAKTKVVEEQVVQTNGLLKRMMEQLTAPIEGTQMTIGQSRTGEPITRPYVPLKNVLRRLWTVLESPFDASIETIMNWDYDDFRQIVVVASITLQTEQGEIIVDGVGSTVVRRDANQQLHENAVSAAYSKAIKNAAKFLGIGLDIETDEEVPEVVRPRPSNDEVYAQLAQNENADEVLRVAKWFVERVWGIEPEGDGLQDVFESMIQQLGKTSDGKAISPKQLFHWFRRRGYENYLSEQDDLLTDPPTADDIKRDLDRLFDKREQNGNQPRNRR